MIDLSFLTEEEQEAIMKVLQRDAELKKAEEERVRHLPEKIKDDVQLKNMSGQWFYEAKSKRHRDKIHGADIIRASMRRKPAAVAEVSQSKSNKAKNSWVSNVNKEVFVQPELHGIVEHQEEELKSSSSSKTVTSGLDKTEERSVKAAVSPVKQRRNPFNSPVSGDNLSSGESENRPDILPQLSKKEILSPSIESQPKTNVLNDETEIPKKPSVEPTDESQKGPVKRPIPKARKLVHKITDSVPQREDVVPKPAKRTQGVNGTGILPRGILKRSSSSSSTDSEVRVNQMLDVQSKSSIPTTTIFEGEVEKNTLTEEAEESTQISLEKLKQVRFSSSIGKRESLQSPRIHHSKEMGELDLLESGEIKTSENDPIGTDSLGNKQTSTVKSLGTHSSAVHVKTHSLQEDKPASSPCDANGSVFLVNETVQTKIITPKKLETPQKTSTNILSNSNKELSVDETCENKSNQSLSCESKLLKNSTDEHLLSAETKAHDVSNTNSAALQQGKPDLVEERVSKQTFEPDRHADEFVKVADESVSKVLDWFKRSSGTEDRKSVSARSQGRELKEVGSATGAAVLPTEYSGTSMDGKPEVIEELPSGRDKQLNAISPTTISEDKHMIKERRKPKQGKDSEEQNDKSLTESDCTRIKDKESGQEIKQQNQKSRVLEHHEHKLPAQKYESEKAIREKRRIREIRAFWERDKTIPSHKEKEVGINTNASGSGALKGLRESDKIKPTAERLPYGLDDQSKNTLRSAELRCAIVASKNERENSFEFGPACDVRKTERTLPADSEIHEPTKLAKASNIKPRVSATSASPEIKDKDRKETFKGKVGASSQQKPNFQVFSLKEKMNEKSKNQISNPSQFQSLRNFWDAGVKLQSSIDRGDVSLPNNTVRNNTSVTHERKSKEDKGRDNVSNQVLIQHQTQASEREKPEKLDSVICELPLGSLTLKGLKVTHAQNTDSVQPVKKTVISQPQEQMGLHKHEVKEPIEKSIVSTKEHPPRGSQKMQAGLQNLLRETSVCQPPELRVGMKASETMNNISQTNCTGESTSQQDISQSEEVNETAERSVAPPKVSGLSSALEKLMKEASETPSPKPRRVDRTLQRTAEMQAKSTTYQHDGESQQEISESIQKSVAPSKVSGLSSALEKLQKEASETPPPKPKRVYSALNGTAEMQVKSTAYQHDGESQQEISESIEKSVAPSKVSGLSSALEKLLKEASETPPPKPKRVYNTERRTAEMQVERTAYLHDGESPRGVSEFIERSVAPSKVSGLSSALEKLLKEASETPPPKPKDVDNTLHGTAEMQVKNTNYQCDGDSLQEISESVEKSVAPPKVSGLSSALEKLLKEASETPPPKPKRVDNTLQRTAEMQVKSTTYQHDGESLQEINEYIEKSVAPSKVSGLSSALEKLLKEASETPPPKPKRVYNTERRTAEMQVERTAYLHDGESPREVSEFIERSVAPSKVSGLSSALEKLLKEASETPPPKPKDVDNTLHGTAEMQVKNTNYQCDGDSLQEISESVEKSVAPPKVSGLSSALEKLLKEASETPPPKPKRVDRTLQRTAEMQVKSVTYQHNGASLQEKSGETTETSALSKAEYRLLDVNLQKLLKGVSETPGPMLENTDEKMHGKMSTSQSMCPPSQEERDHPREIEETIERTSVSDIAKFRDFSSSVERLLQEASEASSQVSREVHKQEKSGDFCMFPLQKESLFTTMSQPYHNALTTYTGMKTTIKSGTPEQNIEASVDTEASDILKRNGALNQKEQRNVPPIDLLPLEGGTNTAVNKPFKVNARGRTDESTSSDASENNLESKELLRLRRTSTPLKDESNSPQPGGAQLCLAFQHEVTDEEDGYSSNLGSRFSDENSDSHSGTESSTRSEEELNPVLMALKRSADRKMPSKSLEDIPSATSNKGKIKIPKEELALSAEDVSTVPPQPDQLFSNPEKLKGLSKSVPSFLQEESDDRETDTASESSYSLGRIKKSPSSLTNLSGSSGMASLSSVSGSLMSVYSGDFGNVDVKGNIQFAIDYVEQLNELHIFICQCKDLAVADVKRQRSDPYVKTYLLPEKYKLGKRKTSVKKKTFNPVYNEILRYKIEKDLLKNQSLNISVWHNDTFGRNSFLGEVELDLGTWDWNDKSNKQINWFPLKPRTSTMALELENRGEMKLALKYVPQPTGGKKTLSTGEVHIWVKECHDLPPLRGNRLNSFIKCTILPDTSRKSRQKTRTVAKTTNPVFNHTMVYDGFRPEDLKEACIELTVWDHNKLANHFLGGLRIGLGTGRSYGTTVDWMDSTSDESALWEKMINLPNTWVEDTIPLRMLMVAKLTK